MHIPARAPPRTPLIRQDGMSEPWSLEVGKALRQAFKLKEFRPNQLEIINATLAGRNVFVLMPTGGGKSLCYQLPALVSSGRTRGVTIVVSPLLSLMADQVSSLTSKGILSLCLSGDLDAATKRWAYEELSAAEPRVRLVYITPEMIAKSSQAISAITALHRRQRLARIVVDEAHCVSQWGHDFRPDYKDLGRLKQMFPDVPVMALTATANAKVRVDVVQNLNMGNCLTFEASFNRANLTYEVVPKNQKAVHKEIAEIARSFRKGTSGIVYCVSRRQCEEMAEKLNREYRIPCAHYHAGMEKDDRHRIQSDWQAGKVDVIVATVAFGMGIDKPDVRFVIHYSMPQSLEGYYQETGRAGRDGELARCILFYAYRDKATHEYNIDRGEGSWEQKERQRHNLREVVTFCENQSDCRRVQLLGYFGETFDRRSCNRTCDNCRSSIATVTRDMTEDARNLTNIVRAAASAREKVTLPLVVDAWRGSSN
ncbi:MAG: P-loop containing nucleoside triphosphate hydrolase protein, partial [Olpidium bornovanus]